ncbi:MAG: hypothetical protein ACOVOW_01115 [Spirosomataceae bacterium]
MKNVFLYCATLVALLGSCQKDIEVSPQESRYQVVAQTLGNGKVYTWMTLTSDKKPSAVGITFTKGAFENLSHTSPPKLVLTFPTESQGLIPFDHLYLDFAHAGHSPAGVYDTPHFDIHFFIQSLAERLAIPAYSESTSAKFENFPDMAYLPADYIRVPEGEAQMGVHWVYSKAPELTGGKFTETFVVGSYDGKMTFFEPMVTLDLLTSKPNISKNIPLPSKFAKESYYPMKYSIKQDGDDVVVSLENMMLMK